MLGRLLEGEATRRQLIDYVDLQVEDAYEKSPFDSFARDLRLLRMLGFAIRYSRARGTYRLERFDHPVFQLHLSKRAVESLGLLKATFQGIPHEERVEALLEEIKARLTPGVYHRIYGCDGPVQRR
jgi:hypothetical protein